MFPAAGGTRPSASRIRVQIFAELAQKDCEISALRHGSLQFALPADTWPSLVPASAIADRTRAWRSTPLRRGGQTGSALLRKEKTSARTRYRWKAWKRTQARRFAALHPESPVRFPC